MPRGHLNTLQPVNWRHPLNWGRVAWWLALPHLYGGPQLIDLCGLWHGTLANGPQWVSEPNGFGQLACNASIPQYVQLPMLPLTANEPFSVAVSCIRTSNFNAGGYTGLFDALRSNLGWAIDCAPGSGPGIMAVYGAVDTAGPPVVYLPYPAYYRFLLTWTPAAVTLYVNGVAAGSASATTFTPTYAPRLGADQFGDGFPGNLDGASAWSRALTSADAWVDYEQWLRGYPDVLNWRRRRGLGTPSGGGGSVVPWWTWTQPMMGALAAA